MNNRTIKFKIYHKNKLWGIEELRSDGWYSMCYELNPDKGERWSHIVFRDEGFLRMQFTGLLDKNGKEIFCLDKFQDDNQPPEYYMVDWNDKEARFEVNLYGYAITVGEGGQEVEDSEITCIDRNVFEMSLLTTMVISGNYYEASPSPKK